MRIGVIGTGNIGGNLARLLVGHGHDLMVSYSRDGDRLAGFAQEIGARAGSPRQAAEHGEAVLLSVPWVQVDDALEAAGAGHGTLDGRVVIDTTNPFVPDGDGSRVLDLGEVSAARLSAAKVPGAHWVKAFNTVTSGFLADSAGRTGEKRVVMFYATDSDVAAQVASRLIADAGFTPARVGDLDHASVLEPPRRAGSVFGEEYRLADADDVLEAVRAGQPLPPAPPYST
jgi:8-hydroxy-5-deazaflavin:NADPH oxidoreductase